MRKTRVVSAFVIAFVLALGAGLPASAKLISQSSELSMGRDAARQIEAKYPVSHDTALNNLVRRMGTKIASVSSRPGITWTFKVLNTPEVNALSVPGYVYVNKGLISFVGSDRDQLATIVAHEVAHTTARHAAEQAEKSLIGGAIVSLLFKKQTQMVNLFANLAMLGYSRKDEYEADKLGVRYAHKAGYDPNGMLRFLQRLQAKQGLGSSGLGTYFKTHPPTADRIGLVRKEIANLP